MLFPNSFWLLFYFHDANVVINFVVCKFAHNYFSEYANFIL